MGRISLERSFGTTIEKEQVQAARPVAIAGGNDSYTSVSNDAASFQARVLDLEDSGENSDRRSPIVEAIQAEYPVLPRHRTDQDLPCVPAEDVVRRNGNNGAKLCLGHFR